MIFGSLFAVVAAAIGIFSHNRFISAALGLLVIFAAFKMFVVAGSVLHERHLPIRTVKYISTILVGLVLCITGLGLMFIRP